LIFIPTVHAQSKTAETANDVPVDFKIAFIGDSGIGSNADAVLNLILSEGADIVVHAGDLDYGDDPLAFDANVSSILGSTFPYFYCAGNHDANNWFGTNGYQDLLEDRLNLIGVSWTGDLGAKSHFTYNGMFFLAMAPNEVGIGKAEAANYIRDQLAANDAMWSVVFWHKNQQHMQVGGKSDEVGWDVYEESRIGGAFVATGHEHSYSRTHLMSGMQSLTVASTSDTLILKKDDPLTTGADEGRGFAFVSGLGGIGIRDQELFDSHWASIYSSTQGATYGALFGEFNYQGHLDLAHFYFKNIQGTIIDEFFVRSDVEPDPGLSIAGIADVLAALNGERVVVSWRAPLSSPTDRFSIELSPHGSGFRAAGGAPQVLTPNADGRFAVSAPHPGPGEHLVRLKVDHADGSSEFSYAVELSVELSDAFLITPAYPNPATTATRFDLMVREPQRVRVLLFDLLGRKVKDIDDETLEAGTTRQIAIYTGDLPQGTYFYRVEGADFVATRSFVVGR
jgi:hypothetical protein